MTLAGASTGIALTQELSGLADEALAARCAWLYHVGELSQGEVASKLGVSRTRVNRLLQEARSDGRVSIRIDHDAARLSAVEQAITDSFKLDFCLTTPPIGLDDLDLSDPNQRAVQGRIARRAVGVAAARFFEAKLRHTPSLTVGVAWGRTCMEMAANLAGLRAPEARFVSLMGSFGRHGGASAFEVVQGLSARTGGQGFFLPVPFVADTPSDCRVLMAQSVVQETLGVAREADINIISVGELDEQALIRQLDMISATDLNALLGSGAVADTAGHFFDSDGRLVHDHPLDGRMVALPAAEVGRVPTVLLAAGGEKIAAIRALLLSGLVDAMIIDGDTATVLSASTLPDHTNH
ncbi:sugar-binding domain-containing protein [Fodinicurvata sp. EGI_FJ10296]|uniref:sugar-binding transcriptional regulator n=1 Tax=Fodinicurvata sp. EGI_FJ10296 TaxID=3231908 RepID=UPI003451E83D